MKYKNGKLLVVSAFLCFLLVLSVSSVVVQPSVSVGAWSDDLPTVDGSISEDDKRRSDHLQISDVPIMTFGGVLEWTSDFDIFLAANDSQLYIGMNITNIPFLASVVMGPSGPTEDPANATFISIYFDNDNNNTIDNLEDAKSVYFLNEITYVGEDQFWNASDPNPERWGYASDSESGDGPDPQNITALGVKHSNPTEQGSIGNLTVELFMHWRDDLQERDGGGLVSGSPVSFAIRYEAMVNAVLAGNGNGPGQMDNRLFGETTGNVFRDENDASNFDSVTWTFSETLNLFSADGYLTQTEKDNSGPYVPFSDVQIYGMVAYESTVDIYVVNNATHLYVGVEMSDVPYLANLNWTGGSFGAGLHNFTTIRVVFDNDNNNTLDYKEDAKLVTHGNNSFSLADDQLFNTTVEWDPLGAGFTSDSQNEHGFPPEQGDISAFDAMHSNPSYQGAIGVLTMELTMPLADDASGYDGEGLSDTVGFSIYYQAIVNFNTSTGNSPEFENFFLGATAGGAFSENDASEFHDLVIKGADNTDPTINEPDDVTYEEGETGNSIEWAATDTNPYKYSIAKDGLVVEEGYWESGVAISIDVDGLDVGNYTYVCSVNDTGGNSASDEVDVTVTAPEEVSEFSYGYAFIALITLPLIALITYRKTRKLKV